MNEVKLSGKVMNAYVHNTTGFLMVVIACVHEHTVNGYKDVCESIIRGCLPDKVKSRKLDIQKGDMVEMTGYLKQDHSLTSGGNEHKKVTLYLTDIHLTA